jgi:lysophospholipase L1-like esterase
MKKIILLTTILFFQYSFTPKEITWVALGDSITYLNDHPDETGNRITKGYMTRVAEKLPNIHYTNKGYNGWTAVKIATDIETLGIQKADLYTIFLGTNDWWSSKPLGAFADYQNNTGISTVYGAFRVIINKLRSLNNHATIVLITPMQRVDFVYFNDFKNNAYGSYKPKNGQYLEDFANAVSAIAQYEHFEVVDLFHKKGMSHEQLVRFKRLKDTATGEYKNYPYPQFIGLPFDPNKDEYPYPLESINITYDGLHPSDKGYQMIAESLVKIFKKMKS